jgi:O-antigen/teichoic acid export membrane protein
VSSPGKSAPAPPAHSLRGRFAWGIVGNAGYAFCQWATLAVIARFGGARLVGDFALALAITGPVIMGTNLQLATVLATSGAGPGRAPFRDYFRLRLAACMAAATCITLIALALGLRSIAVLLAAITGAKLIESISDICNGLLQREHRMDHVAWSQLARGVASVAAVAITLAAGGTLPESMIALGLAWAAILAAWDLPGARHVDTDRDAAPVHGPTDLAHVRDLIRLGLPLGLSATIVSLGTNVPRVLVERQLGVAALGVFAALTYFIVAGRLVAIPIASTIAPLLGTSLSSGDYTAFRRHLALLLAIGTGLGVLGVVFALLAGPTVLRVAYGPEFAAYGPDLVVLMVAAALGYLAWYLQVAATALRATRGQLIVVGVALLVTTAGTLALVPRYGLAGACTAVVLGAMAELTGSALLVRMSFVAWVSHPDRAPAPPLILPAQDTGVSA